MRKINKKEIVKQLADKIKNEWGDKSYDELIKLIFEETGVHIEKYLMYKYVDEYELKTDTEIQKLRKIATNNFQRSFKGMAKVGINYKGIHGI